MTFVIFAVVEKNPRKPSHVFWILACQLWWLSMEDTQRWSVRVIKKQIAYLQVSQKFKWVCWRTTPSFYYTGIESECVCLREKKAFYSLHFGFLWIFKGNLKSVPVITLSTVFVWVARGNVVDRCLTLAGRHHHHVDDEDNDDDNDHYDDDDGDYDNVFALTTYVLTSFPLTRPEQSGHNNRKNTKLKRRKKKRKSLTKKQKLTNEWIFTKEKKMRRKYKHSPFRLQQKMEK